MRGDDGLQLADRTVQVVVHDDMIREREADRFLLLGFLQPACHLRWVIAATAQPPFLFLSGRRHHEDDDRVGMDAADLLRAVQLDLEYDVVSGGGSGVGVP